MKEHVRLRNGELLISSKREINYARNSAPFLILVKKANGKKRLCIDYRELNKLTQEDTYLYQESMKY